MTWEMEMQQSQTLHPSLDKWCESSLRKIHIQFLPQQHIADKNIPGKPCAIIYILEATTKHLPLHPFFFFLLVYPSPPFVCMSFANTTVCLSSIISHWWSACRRAVHVDYMFKPLLLLLVKIIHGFYLWRRGQTGWWSCTCTEDVMVGRDCRGLFIHLYFAWVSRPHAEYSWLALLPVND